MNDFQERLERLEATQQIQQLAFRYAFAIDRRDYDGIAECFVPDVRVGRTAIGREALKEWYQGALEQVRGTAHLVANHLIDIIDRDHALAVVYCRTEHELESTLLVHFLQYVDACERVGGNWLYRRRRPLYWYSLETVLDPARRRKVKIPATGEEIDPQLPGWWPSWVGSRPDTKVSDRRMPGFLADLMPPQL